MVDAVYVQILKWARDNPNFKLNELKAQFNEHKELIDFEANMVGKIFSISWRSGVMPAEDKWSLSFEGWLALLEHEELQEARKSSKQALWVAIAAIVISSISSVLVILVELKLFPFV